MPDELRFAADATSAEWLVADIKLFAKSVTSLVPSGYPSYVRVFHPAYRRPYDMEPVSWAEIAAANGTVVNPGMQLLAIARDRKYQHNGQPGVYEQAPYGGSLPRDELTSLVSVLAEHTTTSDQCWFAFWNGWAETRDEFASAPTFKLPSREYHLLTGPLHGLIERAEGQHRQTPNLWWPDDRAWCVATEVDLNSTYIACDDSCRDAIVGSSCLEALAVDPTLGITYRSDPVNPFPSE